MARGRKSRLKDVRKRIDYDKKEKVELPVFDKDSKGMEGKPILNVNCVFKNEELQEIRTFLDINELEGQHTMIGAVVVGKFDVVKRMLRDGCSVNSFQNGFSPIMAAVKCFRLDMVYFLIQKGADISFEDKKGNDIILQAIQSPLWDQDSFLDFLSSIKSNKNFNPNHCNALGYTPLHHAVKRQWKGALETLLINNACPNHATQKGATPLMMASSRCDTDAVKILLKFQADICYEDQRGCTALCFAIAFMIQKHLEPPNSCLELLIAAVNEHSDMTLESYLKSRLELMMNPPVPMYNHVIDNVFVNIISFFMRFIQAGLSMLLDLNVFQKLSQVIMSQINDADYVKAILGVIIELVRYCDCCFLCSSQERIADAFFHAEGEKACLHILDRYGDVKSNLLKNALMPFFFTCTSKSYIARSWLENNYMLIKPYYTKYIRSSMISFPGYTNVSHLQIFKKCLTDFQTLMETLQIYGSIVTEEEKAAERQRRQEIKAKTDSKPPMKPFPPDNYKKPENIDLHYSHDSPNILHKNKQDIKTHNSKEDIGINEAKRVKVLKPSSSEPNFLKYKINNIIKESSKNLRANNPGEQLAKKEIINKDDKNSDVCEYTPTIKLENNFPKGNVDVIEDMFISELEDIIDNTKQSDVSNTESRFQDGFNLFQLDEISNKHTDESNDYKNKSKEVSVEDLKDVLNYLESIFNNILARYESTWQKQWQQGYLDAQGNDEDLLKLMMSLPDLEAYHIEQMTDKWETIKNTIKENARKDYDTFVSVVTYIIKHLLCFQENLEKQHIKIYDSSVIYPNIDLNIVSETKNNEREDVAFEDTNTVLSPENTNIEDIISRTGEQLKNDIEDLLGNIDTEDAKHNLANKKNKHRRNEWIWEDLKNKEESESQSSNKNVETIGKSSSIKTLLLSSNIPVTTKLEMINELSALYDEDTTIDALYKSSRFSELVTKLLSMDIKNCDIFANGLLSMAGLNKQNEFKLYNGGNFGNLELGLDNRGRPMAVKKFIKQDNKSTNLISETLKNLVTSMLMIRNEYLLPYIICLEVDNVLLIATPLCVNNLGEYVPYLCQSHTLHLRALSLVKQIMHGLHYLHSLEKPIVHGNLKPSNILIDGNGTPRLAEFGLQDVLYQQIGPVCSSVIWWSRETFEAFKVTWKLMCSEKGDIQSAGMIAHYILSGGFHPFGTLPESIIENLRSGRISLYTTDSNTNDLLYWMLSYGADDRPNTSNVLMHVCLWDSKKRWKFLLTCCGITQNGKEVEFLDTMHGDLDKIAKQRNINSEWVSVMKNHFSQWMSSNEYADTLSGFFHFMKKIINDCSDVRPLKEFILEVFPVLILNIFRLLQETEWMFQPIFTQFREMN